MRKLFLCILCLAAMMATNMSLKAQEVTITLNPGWNWISYPNAVAMGVNEAFGDFVPMAGDIVKSRLGSSTYINGQWRGGVTQFTPGWGYMYYSSRTASVIFAFSTPSVQSGALTVVTNEPTDISMTTVTCGGSVVSNDSTSIYMKGVCWATHPQPTTNDSYSEDGSGSGTFTTEIAGLAPNTTYYVRAYAVSIKGINYGDALSFTTLDDHDYVDLGLPTGTLWATCNVGASTPEGYGDYFAWGETQPKDGYGWYNYQYCMMDSSYYMLTKYCCNSSYGYNGFTDYLTVLLFEDDAATANWGSDWCMPTKEEWEELCECTTQTYAEQNGVSGRLFTGCNGNSIFLPAAGYYGDFSDWYSGFRYWSSSLDPGDMVGIPGYSMAAYCFIPIAYYYSCYVSARYNGLSVRPVRARAMQCIINATANPSVGGEVSGAGTYSLRQSCTLTATANTGYTFTNWTENGYVVSTNANYTFTVTGNRTLVANFTLQQHTITVSADPTNGGNVTGGGTYGYGQSRTVHATANTYYTFTNWTENGNVVSTDADYTFTVTGNRSLVANFTCTCDSIGGHGYVDLGLPSGILWATCNMGATNPEDYGDYFAWGETTPKSVYNWSTYQYCMGSSTTLTKYSSNSSYGYNGFTDNLTTLLPEDDAATANWGSGWRMPTKEEFQELCDNTTVTWTTWNGVTGRLFTATNGNMLFLPAAGYCDSSLSYAGSRGGYWSSSLYSVTPYYAWGFYFYSTGTRVYNYYRHYGRSVRAVHVGLQN